MYNSQLSLFVCVADYGSFTKAAEKVFTSPTAVMKQINALEDHLNLILLERTKRGVRLTEAGKAIYKDAKYLFDFSKKSIENARQCMETSAATFRVGTSMLNPCKVFMELWQKLSPDLPGYKLQIVPFEDKRVGILSEVSALGEKFDFLVGACDSEAWLSRCNFFHLGEYRMCCAVPKDHHLAAKTVLNISDLYGECVVMGARGDSVAVDNARDTLEQHPQIRIEDTSHFYDIEVFNHCERTQSLLLTLECWKEIHPSLVTIPVNWKHAVAYGILYSLNSTEQSTHFLRLLELFKAELHEYS